MPQRQRELRPTEKLEAEIREAEPRLELTDKLWEEILTGQPRPRDLGQPLGLGVPPEASELILREFLASKGE
jgi:hypothetical protein